MIVISVRLSKSTCMHDSSYEVYSSKIVELFKMNSMILSYKFLQRGFTRTSERWQEVSKMWTVIPWIRTSGEACGSISFTNHFSKNCSFTSLITFCKHATCHTLPLTVYLKAQSEDLHIPKFLRGAW